MSLAPEKHEIKSVNVEFIIRLELEKLQVEIVIRTPLNKIEKDEKGEKYSLGQHFCS